MEQKDSKQLILIVDDSPQNLQVLGMLLEDLDCEIAVASNGQKALESVSNNRPDLILLDIMMPVMDGYETCRQLKANDETAAIPVIFLTALSNSDDIVKGFQMGAVDYVSKPFNGVELLARVKSHLKSIRMMKELEYANNTKNKFFSIIAHDLKNPFYTIIGFSEMLIKNIETHSNEDRLKYLQMIHNSGKDAHDLLENLLNWSRLQIGTIKTEIVPLNSYDVVERVIHFLEPMAEKKSIELIQDDEEEFQLHADENMLTTMLRNLGSNAIKFTPDGGKVTFFAEEASNGETAVQFSVIDTGIGMPEEIKKDLFRIDKKISRKGTNNEGGTGLGLVLVKEFADFHGGNVEIDSKEGEGTRFTVKLPLNHKAGN